MMVTATATIPPMIRTSWICLLWTACATGVNRRTLVPVRVNSSSSGGHGQLTLI